MRHSLFCRSFFVNASQSSVGRSIDHMGKLFPLMICCTLIPKSVNTLMMYSLEDLIILFCIFSVVKIETVLPFRAFSSFMSWICLSGFTVHTLVTVLKIPQLMQGDVFQVLDALPADASFFVVDFVLSILLIGLALFDHLFWRYLFWSLPFSGVIKNSQMIIYIISIQFSEIFKIISKYISSTSAATASIGNKKLKFNFSFVRTKREG